MNKNYLTKYSVMLGAAALGFTACQDYDAGITNADLVKKQYDANFVKTFGNIDPNQDWSMAATVTANVSVGNNPNVIIFTSKPGYEGAKALGVVNGKSGKFTMVKGTDQVYAIANENGKQLVAGYFDVIDGVVNINNQPVAKRNAQTRAAGDPTLGAKLFDHQAFSNGVSEVEAFTFGYSAWQHLRWVKEGDEWFLYYNPDVRVETNTFRKLKHNGNGVSDIFGYATDNWYMTYYADAPEDKPEQAIQLPLGDIITTKTDNTDPEKPITVPCFKEDHRASQIFHAPYYRISGNTKTEDATWLIGDCKTLFWEDDACFLESEDFRSSRKQEVYAKYGATVADLQKGVEFTTVRDGQNINIPMMYGATGKHNVFGYYYYEEGQDSREVNRYILFDDAFPKTNIKVGGKELTSGMSLSQRDATWTDDTEVTCTTRRLVYFGKDGKGIDGNGAGTFDFPKDVKIGFFICKDNGTTWSALTGPTACESWAYSMPSLNQKYFNDAAGPNTTLITSWSYRYGDDSSVSKTYGTVGVDGRVKAITWQYGDKILVGFGDDSGDEDLNDFVFWYDGEVKEDEKPKINITTEETFTGNSWLFACEDLGGTFDYDFNDVVWEVAQQIKEITTTQDGQDPVTTYEYGDVKVRLLAAGGIMAFTLNFDGNKICTKEEAFGTGKNSVVMIQPTPSEWYTIVENPGAEWSVVDNKAKFSVVVVGNDGESHLITAPQSGAPYEGSAGAPEILLVPGDWAWPTELTCIKEAYLGFADWAYNKDMTGWTDSKVAGKTVTR